jgi:hypothetical protein
MAVLRQIPALTRLEVHTAEAWTLQHLRDVCRTLAPNQLRHLRSIDFSHTCLTAAMVSELSVLPALTSLQAMNVNLDVLPLLPLFPHLAVLTVSFGNTRVGLRYAHDDEVIVTPEQQKLIRVALKGCASLTDLQLTNYSSDASDILCSVLQGLSLERLELTTMQFSQLSFLKSLQNVSSLKSLHLASLLRPLCAGAIEDIAPFLPQLTDLVLPSASYWACGSGGELRHQLKPLQKLFPKMKNFTYW